MTLIEGHIKMLAKDKTARQMIQMTPRRPCRCIELHIRHSNAKQGPGILIVLLLINTTDNRPGELQRLGRKSINIQYAVGLVKIMGRLWGGGGWGRCIIVLAVASVNCISEAFKAAWKFMQFDKLREVLNSTLPMNCVSG